MANSPRSLVRLLTVCFVSMTAMVAATADTGGTADAPMPRATASHEPQPFPDSRRVATLINQLGSRRFVARREAERQLLEIGMRAFDQIDAAVHHPDPEISASCRYLISELTVRWTRRDDPPQVKSLLDGYAHMDEMERLSIVYKLGARPEAWAVAPLCRICRYDSSPMVSRQAAIELMRADKYETGYDVAVARLLRDQIGSSVRPSSEWVRLLALQLEDPQRAVQLWPAAIDRAAKESDDTLEEQLIATQQADLLRNLARVELQIEDREGFLAVIDRIMASSDRASIYELQRLFEWDQVAADTQLVDLLLARHQQSLSESKSGLYLMARIRADQNQIEVANELADQAFSKASAMGAGAEGRVATGADLMDEGFLEWGRRELFAAIDEVPAGSDVHVEAAEMLGKSLHDELRDKEATEVMTKLTTALKSDADLLKDYGRRVRTNGRGVRLSLKPIGELESWQYYFQACHLKTTGDKEGQWQALERAANLDEGNADILIAMYHASDDNPERRKMVMDKIHERCRAVEQSINDLANSGHNKLEWSNAYNEWAWLVSNTEGDYDKAVRYSHKSIEIFHQFIAEESLVTKEDTAGLLDTLGRCYFSAGDIDSAIKYQSLAVEYEPHMQVLRRQLEEFEAAKANKTAHGG
ncbi:tetratricopeptide repeat protein [Aeoliella sp. ICT_H6.2]|uniref:Tetratricopeptide repeat protein n=1 Tax=Aeoliella straminimaris TaxID=2954799 RepID=A0A9X2FCK6_9BACT|nr:tetratricopeptide repeat protein [Aeoliella straminimaris]MCO6046490.1 tetratricopeptide repeat protein [Aeoliella straminimaris]